MALTINESNIWCEGLNAEFNLIQLKEYIDKIPIHKLTKKHCNDYIFSQLMYIYSDDLSFAGKYYEVSDKLLTKEKELKISEKMRDYDENQSQNDFFDKSLWKNHWQYLIDVGFVVRLDKQTIDSGKLLLEKYAEEWDTAVISKGFHKDEHLQSVTDEAIYTRKQVNKEFKCGKINLEQKNQQLRINLWKTKWNFILTREIVQQIEKTETFPIILNLKGKNILYNYKSISHILNRHTGQYGSINYFLINKSFHTLKILPNEYHIVLKHCFSIFEKCSILKREDIANHKSLNFEYKNKKYQLYFNQIKDSEELYVSSFYPLESEKELRKLENFKFVKLNHEVGLYVHK